MRGCGSCKRCCMDTDLAAGSGVRSCLFFYGNRSIAREHGVLFCMEFIVFFKAKRLKKERKMIKTRTVETTILM